jgi:hypothetical protein
MTRIGCCPEGTTNVHSRCQDPEEHRQETQKVACGAYSLIPHPAARAIETVMCN